MANNLYKSKFDRDFGKFRIIIDNIGKLPENVPKYAQQAVIYDAKRLAEDMEKNYTQYLKTYGSMKEIARDIPPEPTIRVLPTYGGANEVGAKVTFTAGRKTFYYEYGTGPVGEGKFTPKGYSKSNKHPQAEANGWRYGTGPRVIKAGHAEDLEGWLDSPKWYINLITKHTSLRNFDMWMSPMGVSFGVPAGKFYYDAVKIYNSGLKDPTLSYSGDPATGEYGLRSMRAIIKHDLMSKSKRGFKG